LQAQTAPLKAEIDAMKTQIAARRSTFRLRAGAPSPVPGQSWVSCQASETLVSGSCIGQVEHVDKDRAVGAGQIAIGPYLMNANKTWPGEEPIHTVECRAAATPVRAFAVCMKIE
jgi:hypothetical protein